MARVLKGHFPGIKIAFLGKSYTKPVILACEYVDAFIDLEDFLKNDVLIDGKKPEAILHVFPVKQIAKRAKQLKISLRIGTTNRLYHWATCNKLVKLSRKNSTLHEAQLNLSLLSVFNVTRGLTFEQIGRSFGLTKLQALQPQYKALLQPGKYHLILHPKSQGSAREWGLDNFIRLIQLLNKDEVQIFISGTSKEKELVQPIFDAVGKDVTDVCGLMNLDQFISFINHSDGLVANSTGPLHIAAALGKDAYGIYPPIRPMHPGRWAPLGPKAEVFVLNRSCEDCRKDPAVCHCIKEIEPMIIKAAIDENI